MAFLHVTITILARSGFSSPGSTTHTLPRRYSQLQPGDAFLVASLPNECFIFQAFHAAEGIYCTKSLVQDYRLFLVGLGIPILHSLSPSVLLLV